MKLVTLSKLLGGWGLTLIIITTPKHMQRTCYPLTMTSTLQSTSQEENDNVTRGGGAITIAEGHRSRTPIILMDYSSADGSFRYVQRVLFQHYA